MRFRFDTGGKLLTEIAHQDICEQASFRLDRPMECTTDDVFELLHGAWYRRTIMDGEPVLIPIEGRWVLPKIKTIPQRAAKKVTILVKTEE